MFAISFLAALPLVQLPVAAAGGQVPFHGYLNTWHIDRLGLDPLDGPIIRVKVTGTGRASHLGNTSCGTTDQVAVLATGSITATYTCTAANGDTLLLSLAGHIVGFDPIAQRIDFEGSFEVLAGMGRFGDASGGGTFAGWAKFDQPFGSAENDGPGFFAFEGWLSKGEWVK
jgi:hypothetical protein